MTRDATKEKQLLDRCKLAQKRLLEILDSRGYDWGVISDDDDF
jgi:hypothetical protein